MRLYLDNCCYNHPYYDQNDEIIGSPVLDFEIEQIGNIQKCEKVKSFYKQTIDRKFEYNINILKRVKELSKGTLLRQLDRFHLAFAENANADVLLTTDDKFEKACSKINLKIKVMNPLNYLLEVMRNDSND